MRDFHLHRQATTWDAIDVIHLLSTANAAIFLLCLLPRLWELLNSHPILRPSRQGLVKPVSLSGLQTLHSSWAPSDG
jgi:hypothetical protein